MNEKEIEKMLRDEFNAVVPDNFDQILARCENEVWGAADNADIKTEEEQNQKAAPIKNHKGKIINFLAAAASFAIILGGVYGYNAAKSPSNIVFIDVNPSIEITVNAFGRVLDCEAANTDAKPIVGKYNLNGKKIEEATEKLADCMVDAGYISEDKNSVLISVAGPNQKRAAAFAEKSSAAVQKAVESHSIDLSVMTLTFNRSSDLYSIAKTNGISEGKAALVKNFDNVLPEYNDKNLSQLKIKELNLLVNEYQKDNDSVSVEGKVCTDNIISRDQAVEYALKGWSNLGVAVNWAAARLTADQSGLVYYVTSQDALKQYVSIVNSQSGIVENVYSNIVQHEQSNVEDNSGDIESPVSTQNPINIGEIPSGVNQQVPDNSKPVGTNTDPVYIGKDQALKIASSASGVYEQEISHVHVDLKTKNGQEVYDVDFKYGELDYEIYVDAITGNIVSMKID